MAAAATAAVLFITVLPSRHPELTIPHVLRGGGHLLAAEAHQSQGPRLTRNLPRRQAKTGQGHFLEALELGRRGWSLMKTVLLTLARDNYLLAMIVWFEAINPVLLDAFLLYIWA